MVGSLSSDNAGQHAVVFDGRDVHGSDGAKRDVVLIVVDR